MNNILDLLKHAFVNGYATSELSPSTMLICVLLTAVIAVYICFVYKCVNKNSFYNVEFHLSLFALAIITSAIILTIQSNIVVSLGMVGALSIVRFRTAIKNPMDLIFLFWSISVGIICGAGFAMIAAISSLVVTLGIVVFKMMPSQNGSLVLVVNSASYIEDEVLKAVSEHCSAWKVRARSITSENVNLAIEVKTKACAELLDSIRNLDGVTAVSLVEHNGEVCA